MIELSPAAVFHSGGLPLALFGAYLWTSCAGDLVPAASCHILRTDGSRAEGCLFGCWPLLNREGTHGRGLQPGRAEWRASSAWRVTVGKVQQF